MIYRGGHRSYSIGQDLCRPFKEFSPRNRMRSLREDLVIEYNPLSDKGVIFYRDSISGKLDSCSPEEFITLSCIWNRDYRIKMVENEELGKDAFIMRPEISI